MKFQSGRLLINDQQYHKKVKTPEYKEMVNKEDKQIKQVMAREVVRGPQIQDEGNCFIGYKGRALSHNEVQRMYEKVKMLHADARHVVCVYIVLGIYKCYREDHCDDQEAGMGKVLLKWMKKEKLDDRAVFVVRYCGKKLGTKRGTRYIQAAEAAVKEASVDEHTEMSIDEDGQSNSGDGETRLKYRRMKYKKQAEYAPIRGRNYRGGRQHWQKRHKYGLKTGEEIQVAQMQ